MKLKVMLVLAGLFVSQSAAFADNDPKAIAALLPTAKISLLDAIAFARRTSGPAISAKFEVEDGALQVSVYTVPEGIASSPDAATLTEVSGAAAASPFQPKAEIFADKEHIARAASHLTLMQLSKLSLVEVIRKAMDCRGGVPIDVRNPTVRSGKAVADVVLVDNSGQPFTVTIDLLRGKAAY